MVQVEIVIDVILDCSMYVCRLGQTHGQTLTHMKFKKMGWRAIGHMFN